MRSLETILEKLKQNGISLKADEKIVVPLDELYVEFNGVTYPGRVFLDEGIIVTLQDIDDNYSEKGFAGHPVIWRINNIYETWLSSGSIMYRTQFYVVR